MRVTLQDHIATGRDSFESVAVDLQAAVTVERDRGATLESQQQSQSLRSSPPMNAFSPQPTNAYAAVPMGQQPPVGQTEFLPSISPSAAVYSTAHAVWSPQELHVFHRGLADFPASQYDNVTRYIKIAALLPGKCVRDVAYKAKAMSLAHETMSLNRDQFAKRMKIASYQPHDVRRSCVDAVAGGGNRDSHPIAVALSL